jgi:hypothetical protein
MKGGVAESGRALKWRMVSTLAMINRKQLYWDDFFFDFFEMLKLIDKDYSTIDPFRLIVRWKDGLPIDSYEIATDIVNQVNANIMSKLTAIKNAQGLDNTSAEKELSQIEVEAQKQADISASSSGINI